MTSKPLTKMIVADDEENILEIIKFSIEEMPGLDVRYCRSGEEVIKTALEFQPDLMILDFMMPGMDGATTFQAIRLLPNLANIPIVFLTAKVQKREIEQYLEMGVIDVIPKPFDPMTLPDKILQCWEKANVALNTIDDSPREDVFNRS
jgi:CheY-like chemotaxis protein